MFDVVEELAPQNILGIKAFDQNRAKMRVQFRNQSVEFWSRWKRREFCLRCKLYIGARHQVGRPRETIRQKRKKHHPKSIDIDVGGRVSVEAKWSLGMGEGAVENSWDSFGLETTKAKSHRTMLRSSVGGQPTR